MHLAELDEAVGAQIDDLVDPETIAEIRHLDYHRGNIEREQTEAIDDVLIGTGD